MPTVFTNGQFGRKKRAAVQQLPIDRKLIDHACPDDPLIATKFPT